MSTHASQKEIIKTLLDQLFGEKGGGKIETGIEKNATLIERKTLISTNHDLVTITISNGSGAESSTINCKVPYPLNTPDKLLNRDREFAENYWTRLLAEQSAVYR